jgi:hypothetical protein
LGPRILGERITDIQLIRPKEYQPVASFTYLEKAGIFKSTEGKEWAIEITFDGGRKAQTKDLRPRSAHHSLLRANDLNPNR